MLFISRCVIYPGRERALHFGVVDTDDDVEEIVSADDLKDIVCKRGVRIEGVDSYGSGLKDVEPYQEESTVTSLQTKFAVLHHIHITTYKDWITNIVWDRNVVSPPVSIRLSSLGRRCADYTFWRPPICNRHMITLIFDDNIKFSRMSFTAFADYTGGIGVGGFGAKYDLRELTRDSDVRIIYENVINSGAGLDSIVDRPERLKGLGSDVIHQQALRGSKMGRYGHR